MSAEPDLRALAAEGPVHFVGVGGAGMYPLAELLLREGGRVSGCDAKGGKAVERLRGLGARIHVGHDPAHVEGATAVVTTAAVPAGHPELTAARERGLPVVKRALALGALANAGRVLAVAGTHGKTSTTAVATEILVAAGLDPTGLVGGRVQGWGSNLRYGASDLYVVEADEYDRSFHALRPHVAIVTNLEADHLDVYEDLAGVEEAFRVFLEGVREGGRVVVCADDPGASALLAGAGDAGYSYGLSAGSMLRAVDVEVRPGGTRCRIVERGEDRGTMDLAFGGRHNLRNALGAAAAARWFGAEWDAIRKATAEFQGVGRRFERLGKARGVRILDDYAHHPTEIAATLEAARAAFDDARIVAVFQPHLYSRTRDFHREFGASLAPADQVWVTDVFPAREEPIPGVTGELVADAARGAGGGDVRYHAELDTLAPVLADALGEGDVLLTLGAGSIETLGPDVLRRLEASDA